MSLTTIINEICRFIKKNFIKILVGAIVISVIAILGSLFLPNLIGQSNEISEETELNQSQSDEDTQVSRSYLLDVYSQEPAEFEVFIQLEDGNIFGNSFIFDEYFTSDQIVKEIESETGINYSQTLEHEKKLGITKTSQYRGSIAGIRDSSTNIITIRVQVSETSEENLILAEAFAERIINNEIPFIQGLNVTFLSSPIIGEKLVESDLQMVSSPRSIGILSPTTSENRSILLYGIAGFILGLMLMLILLFIVQLFKNKINYAFQYSWDFNDYHFVTTLSKMGSDFVSLLQFNETKRQLVISQDSKFPEFLSSDNNISQSLTRHTQVAEKIDEIILIIESNKTDKKWFSEQYQLAEKYSTQITIIHLIP